MFANTDVMGRNASGGTCTNAHVGWATRESNDLGASWDAGSFLTSSRVPCLAGTLQRGMRDFAFIEDETGRQWAAAPNDGASTYVLYTRDRAAGTSAPWTEVITIPNPRGSLSTVFFPNLAIDGNGTLATFFGATRGSSNQAGYFMDANAASLPDVTWTLPVELSSSDFPTLGGGFDGDYMALAAVPTGFEALVGTGPTFLAAWADQGSSPTQPEVASALATVVGP